MTSLHKIHFILMSPSKNLQRKVFKGFFKEMMKWELMTLHSMSISYTAHFVCHMQAVENTSLAATGRQWGRSHNLWSWKDEKMKETDKREMERKERGGVTTIWRLTKAEKKSREEEMMSLKEAGNLWETTLHIFYTSILPFSHPSVIVYRLFQFSIKLKSKLQIVPWKVYFFSLFKQKKKNRDALWESVAEEYNLTRPQTRRKRFPACPVMVQLLCRGKWRALSVPLEMPFRSIRVIADSCFFTIDCFNMGSVARDGFCIMMPWLSAA